MRVAIVEDCDLVREQLVRRVEGDVRMTVVGCAVSEDDAVTLILSTQPDAVMLDLTLLEGNGISALRRIRAAGSGVRVIILSNYTDAALVDACQVHGISGYYDKTHATEECLGLLSNWASGAPLASAPIAAAADVPMMAPRAEAATRDWSELPPCRPRPARVASSARDYWQTIIDAEGIAHKLHRLGAAVLSLPQLGEVFHWLDDTAAPAGLVAELAASRRVREVLFRPYLCRHWSRSERMQALTQHYRHLAAHPQFTRVSHGEQVELVRVSLGDTPLRIVCERPRWITMEGELGVSLFVGDQRMYTVMFLLGGETQRERNLMIGCIVGRSASQARDDIRDLTRLLHGCRPRDFILDVTRMLAAALGCQALLGISDEAHRSTHWLSATLKYVRYDTIWQDHGGVLEDSGFYRMPLAVRQRAPEEIPSRKRAEYRRRYQLIDTIGAEIRQALALRAVA